ncbi:hypothetical protein F441_00991 [Phytophthora nicotianae CJ01A1]|uniref:Uncharacterized protein n=1 Tax=Phytophthora nicotianae CJ01A1 TaxID=1317063 RepID=W2XWE1_PHYNI|nr:hypothetical protein F441_00991 [Phytophthora nicotianae CJ01A1]
MNQKSTETAEEKSEHGLPASSVLDEPERRHGRDEPRPSRHDVGSTTSRIDFTWTRTPTTSPLELHRRCAETIERYSANLRERQRKMERLELLLPLPNSDHRKDSSTRATPPTRSTPPRPAKRNKLGSTTPVPHRAKNSPGITSPAWSLSSTKSRISTRLKFDDMTTSPLINKHSNNQRQVKLPFRGTPDKTATQESTPASHSEGTPELSSIDTSTNSSHKKSMELSPTWSQRQQDFMAAIDAESDSSQS